MQDRFKFRVWLEFENKMIIPENESFFALNQHGSLLKINDKNEVCWARIGHTFADEDIMQCTGLKDKNGKLIYEGDIVKFAFHELAEEKAWEKAVIVWGDKYKYPAFDLDKCEFECNGLSYIFNEGWIIEVIGNIYENTELLED